MPKPVNTPEVRQCEDPQDPQFGCVAVQSGQPNWAWGVFHPVNGGHWEANDGVVSTWTVLK